MYPPETIKHSKETQQFDERLRVRFPPYRHKLTCTLLAYFSIWSSSAPSAEPSTSSTTPGSPPSSPRRRAVARVASAPRSRLAAPRRSIPLTRSPLWGLTALLLLLAQRHTMRAGYPHPICSAPRQSVFAPEPPRPSPRPRRSQQKHGASWNGWETSVIATLYIRVFRASVMPLGRCLKMSRLAGCRNT
jgi:hypothetical protein